ncbi:hypothetical protein [Streptomyces mangrovisoli]|uniref:Uncharacterized protein n=1 Tax=Streptomyces mangrovisoli TaxID=1428628 RepID=A0A1J4P188_9ACTN|nr:hypothetical protein [Streptomyces mangrovisoli]OIJ67245.1 hypothetical protein WN71_014700 [Streptomyces mangrovisoli]
MTDVTRKKTDGLPVEQTADETRTGRDAETMGETGTDTGTDTYTDAETDTYTETDTGRDTTLGHESGLGYDTTTDGSESPSAYGSTGEGTAPYTPAPATADDADETAGDAAAPLVARAESDELNDRMRHAVAGFVDAPRGAVEEADRVLEDAVARFTEAVTRRRSTLRNSWQSTSTSTSTNGDGRDGEEPTAGDTEQLRLALRDYRELADHLLSR